jgi:hypothetical protein
MSAEAAYLTVVSAVAGTLTSVALFFYLSATKRFAGWYTRWCWRNIADVRPLGRDRVTRHLSRGFGVLAVGGWRLVLAGYLAVTLYLVVPVMLTLLAFSLSFRLIYQG